MSRNYSEGLTKSMIFQLPSEGEITGLSPSQDLAKFSYVDGGAMRLFKINDLRLSFGEHNCIVYGEVSAKLFIRLSESWLHYSLAELSN
jgi:hypothetical protein